jgi:hypothetical protein
MIKKFGALILVFCLFLSVLSPSLVQAQGELTVLKSSAVAIFPSQLSFSLSARSSVNITDIRLCYGVDRDSFAEVTSEGYVGFTPSTVVNVSWTLETVKIGGLPPGATVKYWWRISDASGKRMETAPAQLRFEDTRYSWRSLTEGKVTIYWYKGDDLFARELMSAVQQALVRLARDTGASPQKPVELYIYANQQDFLGALTHPMGWEGGVNFSRYPIMAIGISLDNIAWGKTTIAHELTHLVINQMTLNPYSDLPNWLSEGLAMYNENEGLLGPEFNFYLTQAIAKNSLISVQSLSSPFSANDEEAYLSYAESYSLVEFLIASYGQGKMLELLNTFRQGSSYDGALKKVYGFDMGGLDSLWRDYVTEKFQLAAAEGMQPVLATAGF